MFIIARISLRVCRYFVEGRDVEIAATGDFLWARILNLNWQD